jgi:hypothetical protein
MIATISSVYFLASSLPTFQFWTLPLKEVLLFISSILGVNEWIVIYFYFDVVSQCGITSCNW